MQADLSETYGHVLPSQALHFAIYGAKQRSAVFTEIRLIKKEEKHAQSITANDHASLEKVIS